VLRVACEPYILGGLACYVVSLVIWIVALSKTQVSIACSMLSMGYVINALVAAYLFGEMLTDLKLIGLLTIIIGVYLIA
jgi:drug/metabolite transporter (DMT)-like permease